MSGKLQSYQYAGYVNLVTGTINSVNLASYYWNISWNGGSPADESLIMFGPWGYISGPASQLYGTLMLCQYVLGGSGYNIISSRLINGSPGEVLNCANLGTVYDQPVFLFWIGRTPSQVPTGNFDPGAPGWSYGNILGIS